jgi:hypothetical protein
MALKLVHNTSIDHCKKHSTNTLDMCQVSRGGTQQYHDCCLHVLTQGNSFMRLQSYLEQNHLANKPTFSIITKLNI